MERGWRSGPRLPKAPPSPSQDEIADPAHGAKVPRCKVCGLPGSPGNRLIPGLWAYIHFSMQMALCERCVNEMRPAINPDPLTLEEVA